MGPSNRIILHVDFDAFFVSCGTATRPELKGKPVVVCHSQSKSGAAGSTSEIASCSYEAREKGVRNGMSLGQARRLCPDVQTIP
jgi:DNA repair protein REV1